MENRRNPFVAGILAFLTPGLGHAYSGRVARGAVLAVALVLGLLLAVLLVLLLPWKPWNVLLPFLFIVVAAVAVIVDAVLQARKTPAPFVRRWYNRWYLYAVIVVLWAFVVTPGLQRTLRSVVRTFTITSGSMAPTLIAGDYLVSVMWGPNAPSGGQIVLHHWPDNAERVFVSRIVGLPGDTLEMRSRALFVNGAVANEPYVQVVGEEDGSHEWMNWQVAYLVRQGVAEPYQPSRDTWGPLAVPEDMYFVLGDNRDQSLDSRYLGLISTDDILGHPRRLYLSWDEDAGDVRWNRVGQAVK